MLKEVKEVRNGLRKKPSRSGEKGGQVLIVGHSLGGAYAQIVGALGEIQTMSLSPFIPRVAISGSLTDRAKCMAYKLEMEPPGTYNCIKKATQKSM